jgi:hypothetical protein
MTRGDWKVRYGQYLASECAPNGDFQIRVDLVRELLEQLLRAKYGYVGFVTRYRDAMTGALRFELLGDFLAEARRELDEIERTTEVVTYR